MAEIVPVEQATAKAGKLLLAGQVVALPTETVYGLAADATNGEAVAGIFEAKGRPRFNPLIVHVCDMEMAQRLAVFDDLSLVLADAFWPGPLTLVLPLRDGHGLHDLVSAGLDTVGLRMPQGFMRSLIAAIGRPLAAPSANSSGKISATSAAAVERDLGGRIAMIVDGGPTHVGVESTIVKVEDGAVRLLRPGGVSADEIEDLLDMPVLRKEAGAAIEAPGMMASHYAPAASVRLDATRLEAGEALLAFGPSRIEGADAAVATQNLSTTGNLREAAANLFAFMAELDETGAPAIAVEPIPRDGLGEAINDRLSRAAAPRDKPKKLP